MMDNHPQGREHSPRRPTISAGGGRTFSGETAATEGVLMTSMSDTRPVPVSIDRRTVGVIAGLAAGPLFLTVAGLLTWAELDYLHGLGWHYTKDNPVPWP